MVTHPDEVVVTLKRDARRKCSTALAGLVAGLALIAAFAGRVQPTRQAHCPVRVVAAFDTSRSFRPELPAAVGATTVLCSQLNPDSDLVTTLRVAYTTEEISDQAAPESGADLRDLLIARLSPIPTKAGTRPHLFWQAVATRLAREAAPTAVAFWTDGDNDDRTAASTAAIQEAARRLARNPHVVYVGIYGVLPDNRAALRRDLAPLGDRLHLFEIHQSATAPLLGALTQASRQTRRVEKGDSE